MALIFWTCPNCKRRVPAAVDTCRCGFLQVTAAAATSGPRAEPMPWDVQALLAGLVLVLVFGVVQLFRPHPRSPMVPLLGYLDPPRTSPAPGRVPPATLQKAPRR